LSPVPENEEDEEESKSEQLQENQAQEKEINDSDAKMINTENKENTEKVYTDGLLGHFL